MSNEQKQSVLIECYVIWLVD